MKKVFALLMMPLFGILPAMAQEEVREVKVTTVTVPDTYWEDASDENSKVLNTVHFKDNWFLGIQAGAMMSWGTNSDKASFGDKMNPVVGLQWGKWMAPWLGVRFTGFYGKNSGQLVNPDLSYKFTNYGANFDMLFSLTNMLTPYKENRFFNLVGIAGVGVNHTTNYDDAAKSRLDLGKTHKSNMLAVRVGAEAIFRLSKCWDLNVEATNNWLNSNFDGQAVDNKYDGHWDFLLGLTYRFKNTDGSRQFTYAKYNAARYDLLNDEINRLRAEADAKRNAPAIVEQRVIGGNLVRTLISFEDNKSEINELQEVNVFTAAEEYKKLGDASIYITPYGDSKPANNELFVQRANSVKNMLMNEFNIPAGSIFVESNPQILKNLDAKNTVIVFVNE